MIGGREIGDAGSGELETGIAGDDTSEHTEPCSSE